MPTGLTVFGLKNDTFASVEKQLIKRLLDRYAYFGKIGRPVMKTDESIDIQFGMSLIQILDVDEQNQVLQTSVWLTYVSILLPHSLIFVVLQTSVWLIYVASTSQSNMCSLTDKCLVNIRNFYLTV